MALIAQSGSFRSALPTAARSMRLSRIKLSAYSGSVIPPTPMTGMFTLFLIFWA